MNCFEGMKAFKTDDGKKIVLFRPLDNFKRLNKSGAALGLPVFYYLNGWLIFKRFDENEILKCLMKLLLIDREWIPPVEGFSLYMRPILMSTTVIYSLPFI